MDLLKLSELSNEELASYVRLITPKKLEEIAPSLLLSQFSVVLLNINEEKDADWQKKTVALIQGAKGQEHLEAAGHVLTLPQLQELLKKSIGSEKLQPILVGLPHSRFVDLLMVASDKELMVLKQQSSGEPIQYHLNIFHHDMTHFLDEQFKSIEKFSQDIEQLNLEELSRAELLSLFACIKEYSEWDVKALNLTNRALQIAWNTNRPDIIEKLSNLKDRCKKFNVYIVGDLHKGKTPSTGIFAKLEDKLNSIYGDPNNPNDVEALKDNESSMDGIAKCSVWYLQDYWEAGLLPHIKSKDKLDLPANTFTEKERSEYREKLFNSVSSNLERLGLATVKDLKQAHIFSKKSLREYISAHKKSLMN